eukprot:6295412-Prymnesium_polylepis.1
MVEPEKGRFHPLGASLSKLVTAFHSSGSAAGTTAPIPRRATSEHEGDDESEWEEWEATDRGGFRRVSTQNEAGRMEGNVQMGTPQ